jgi:hypothetical protein
MLHSIDHGPRRIDCLNPSVVKADAARASAIPGAAIDSRALGPGQASRAVREYLEGIDAAGCPETMRKNISVTDPAAEWTCAPGGPAFFAYSTNPYPQDQATSLQLRERGRQASSTTCRPLLALDLSHYAATAKAVSFSLGITLSAKRFICS